MFIKEAKARIIRDSRNEKTIEIVLKTYEGTFSASAPAGKSKGAHEVEYYNPAGIIWSEKLANNFFKKLEGKSVTLKEFKDIESFEKIIKNFEKENGNLGGNVVYAIETAILKASAKENKKQLWQFILDTKPMKIPMPVGNCLGGGLHSRGINGKKPDFQEFLLIPDEKTFSKAVTKNIHAYFYLRSLIRGKHNQLVAKTNDEHAHETSMTNEESLDLLTKVCEKFSLRLGLDVASSSFFDKGHYNYKNKNLIRDRLDQVEYMKNLVKKYNLFYVEDPLQEEDFASFKQVLSDINPKKTLIVGDDLTTTNVQRTQRAIRTGSINAMIIKPNQIGSIVEVAKVVELCKKNNIKMVFSHRSGETMDTALADYAIGFQADFIKTGIYGKERLVKLKRIIDIEKMARLDYKFE